MLFQSRLISTHHSAIHPKPERARSNLSSSEQSTIHCIVAGSNNGVIQPYIFKPQTDSQEEEEKLLQVHKVNLHFNKVVRILSWTI